VANHVIHVNPLNPLSIMYAELQYRMLKREFDRKVDVFIARVAELGRSTADEAYGGAVTVTAEPIENGYAIIASGEAVGFLEFGAGDATTPNEFAAQVSYDVRPGSWSERHYDAATNKPRPSYHIDGKWEFNGVIYTEIRPRNAMQSAWETVQQEWRAIAEEVFA